MLTKSLHPPVINWLEDYGVWEYLLTVTPSDAIVEKIKEEKADFISLYNDSDAIVEQPYITIAAFLAKEQMGATLIPWIQNICNAHSCFPVMLRNFSGFVPHTIYVKVQNPQPFKQLAESLKALDHFIRASECPPLKLTTTPHLTIVRRLSEETYFKALPTYCQRLFQQTFMAYELTLIRRATSNGKCVTVHRFSLVPELSMLFN